MSNSIRSQLYKNFVKQCTCFYSSNIENNELLYANAQSEWNLLKNDGEKFLIFLIKNSNLKFFFLTWTSREGGGGISQKRTNLDRGEGGVQKCHFYLDVLNGWPLRVYQ